MAFVTYHVIVPCTVSMFSVLHLILDKADPLPNIRQELEPPSAPSRWVSTLGTFWLVEFSSSLLHSTILSAGRRGWSPTLAQAAGEAGRRLNADKGIKWCVFPTSLAQPRNSLRASTVQLIAED